jgi:hypothetical protein
MITLALASLAAGFAAGWLSRTIIVMAQISRSQERMQRKVRYWQCQAALARRMADQLAGRLAAYVVLPPETNDRPPADNR